MNQAATTPARTFKRKASWEGIRLEHYRLPSGELPEHAHPEHLVMVLLSDGASGELRTASGAHINGTLNSGSVYVLPSGLEHTARLDNPTEHLAMFLDPSTVRR